MRKTLISFFVAVAVVFMAGQCVKAVDLSVLPGDLRKTLEDLLATRFPPVLKSVTLDPAAPVAGQPTAVTVEISNNADITTDETSNVSIFFSKDAGATWESIDLESEDNKVWKGELPAFDSGAEVTYGVFAKDSSENVFTTVSCKVNSEELLKGEYAEGDCVNGGEGNCDSTLPRGCMFKQSVLNDPTKLGDQVPGGADILDQRVGYDDESIFIDIIFKDKVDPGSINPMDIRAFVAILVDTDKAGSTTNIDELIDAGGIVVYAKHAAIAGGMFKPCFLGYNKAGTLAQDEAGATCKTPGTKNHLVLKVKRSALPENTSGRYDVLSAVATITNISPVTGKLFDFTHITTNQFASEYTFVVE